MKRAQFRTLSLLVVIPAAAALIFVAYFYAAEAPRREAEMQTMLDQIRPPDGATYLRTGVISLPGLIQLQAVYDKPKAHPDLKPHYDEVLLQQGWLLVRDQLSDEGGRQLTTYQRGDYQAVLEVPLDSMNFDYPFVFMLSWPKH